MTQAARALKAPAALAERVEQPVATRTRVSGETLRSQFGALFLFWSLRRASRAARRYPQ